MQRDTNPLTLAGRLLAWATAAYVCAHVSADPDLWGHIKFGADALRDRALAVADPYSFTQDVPWINHEWLSEIGQALAYGIAGVFGLIALKVTIAAAACGALAFAVRNAREPHRSWMLAAAIVGIAPAAYTIRPQLWTLLAVPLLWLCLHSARPLAYVPIIFALWANLHGGWIVGVGIAGLWLVGRAIDVGAARIRSLTRPSIAIAAGVAATLVNPYGWRLWQFVWSTVRVGRDITEWRPLWQQREISFFVLWWIAALVIVLPTVLRRRSAITWANALPVAWLGVMSLFVTRLAPIFGEVALLGLVNAWGSEPAVNKRFRAPELVLTDAVVVVVIAALNVIPSVRCLPISGSWAPDVSAATVFEPDSVRGRLVLPFDWGEYAIWHFGPRLRVSVDGRRETIYSERMRSLQAAMEAGRPEGLDYFARERPEYIWLRTDEAAPVVAWAPANGYRVDARTSHSFVATRADLPQLAGKQRFSVCFP